MRIWLNALFTPRFQYGVVALIFAILPQSLSKTGDFPNQQETRRTSAGWEGVTSRLPQVINKRGWSNAHAWEFMSDLIRHEERKQLFHLKIKGKLRAAEYKAYKLEIQNVLVNSLEEYFRAIKFDGRIVSLIGKSGCVEIMKSGGGMWLHHRSAPTGNGCWADETVSDLLSVNPAQTVFEKAFYVIEWWLENIEKKEDKNDGEDVREDRYLYLKNKFQADVGVKKGALDELSKPEIKIYKDIIEAIFSATLIMSCDELKSKKRLNAKMDDGHCDVILDGRKK